MMYSASLCNDFFYNFQISWSVSVLRRLLEKMSERRDIDEVAMAWLLSAQLGNQLIKLVEQLCGSTKSKSVAQYSQDEELVTLFNFVLSNGNKKGIYTSFWAVVY